MPSSLSGESFIAVVQKSGLIEPDRLKRLTEEYKSANGGVRPADAFADYLVAQNAITKWQSEKLLQGKHKGYFLGKYRLLSLLGKGGMSSVYLAEHMLMRRRCAIKVLPAKRVNDTSYLARFHREAQAVASLDHPNIVRAYDVDQQADRDTEIHFLVMEYVEGASLQELVFRKGRLAFADAVEYVRQAAVGLAHAHEAGLVHRDIKPGNLLLDNSGVVKILDLGLARFFDNQGEGDPLTIQHDEKVLGTADYLAPEQALDSHRVDARADIYSLGCTLYFLLTGHPPFTEGTLAQRLMAHQQKEPQPVESERTDVPPTLIAVLRTMMAKKADERYQTATETAAALQQWLAENTDENWRKRHPQSFGAHGVRAASSSGQGSGVTSDAAASTAVKGSHTGSTEMGMRGKRAGDSGVNFPVMQPVAKSPQSAVPAAPIDKPVAPPIAKPVATSKPIAKPVAAAPPDKPAAPVRPMAKVVATPVEKLSAPDRAPAAPLVAAAPVAALSEDRTPPAAPPASGGVDLSFLSAGAPLQGVAAADTVDELDPLAAQIAAAPLDVNIGADLTLIESAEAANAHTADATLIARSVDEADATTETETPQPDATLILPEAAEFDLETEATLSLFPPVMSPASAPPPVVSAPIAAPGQFVPAVAPVAVAPIASPSAPRKVGSHRGQGARGGLSPQQKKLALIGGVVLGLAVLIGGAAAFGVFGSRPDHKSADTKPDASKKKSQPFAATDGIPTVAPPPTDAVWKSKREAAVGPTGDFKTISEALAIVKKHFQSKSRSDRFVIKVAAGTYSERIVIEKGFPDNVVIRGADGAALEPPGSEPVIRAGDVEGLQIANFTVRAGGRPSAIELADRLPRSRLQRLRISGFSETGIAVRGVVAYSFEDARLFFEDLRLEGSGSAVGIAVSRGGGADGVDSSHLAFQRCRFLGPLAAGVTVSGSESLNFEFRECIFSECQAGVKLLEQTSWREFVFVQNTFYKCGYGVLVAEQPPPTQKGFSFRRNLFAETAQTEVFIEKGFDDAMLRERQMLGSMDRNWTDQSKPDLTKLPKGELSIFGNGHREPINFAFASTNPQDAKFLAMTDASPHKRVPDGQRQDEKTWIGAVGP
jgi:serine/threonine-protein kinase